jgi:NADH-quinone oxidoreductase subunit D
MRLALRVTGEHCLECLPVIGYLHRGVERVVERRPWEAVGHLLEHLDPRSGHSAALAWHLAIEDLLGLEVSTRATHLRTILSELDRIASHLHATGSLAGLLGVPAVRRELAADRQVLELRMAALRPPAATTGALHPGGVARDPGLPWERATRALCDTLQADLERLDRTLTRQARFRHATRGVGEISRDLARAYGITGPILRAAGDPRDLRRIRPYLSYGALDLRETPRHPEPADCHARHRFRVQEALDSLGLVRQLLDTMPHGEVDRPQELPPDLPAGDTRVRVESPRGELGLTLLTDGGPRVVRLRIRSPSFVALAALPELARGVEVPDLLVTLASLDLALGEVDR